MRVHSFDKTISQTEIKNASAKAVFKSLASYFNVSAAKVERALKDLIGHESVRQTANRLGMLDEFAGEEDDEDPIDSGSVTIDSVNLGDGTMRRRTYR